MSSGSFKKCFLKTIRLQIIYLHVCVCLSLYLSLSIYIYISKLPDRCRGRLNSYYTKVLGRAPPLSLDYSTYPLSIPYNAEY